MISDSEKDEIRGLLANWGRWANDEWLRHHLGFSRASWMDKIRIAGSATVRVMWVNEASAQIMEGCVVQLALEDFELFRIVVDWYPYRMAADEIAEKYGFSRRTAYNRLDQAHNWLWPAYRRAERVAKGQAA